MERQYLVTLIEEDLNPKILRNIEDEIREGLLKQLDLNENQIFVEEF